MAPAADRPHGGACDHAVFVAIKIKCLAPERWSAQEADVAGQFG